MQFSKIVAWFGLGLHLFFAFGEMVPLKGGMPKILSSVLEDRKIDPTDERLQPLLQLLETVVLNAGAYNLIVALGFLWAACPIGLNFKPAPELARPLLAFFSGAAILAGFVGLTLSPATWAQVAVGAIGLFSLLASTRSDKSRLGSE